MSEDSVCSSGCPRQESNLRTQFRKPLAYSVLEPPPVGSTREHLPSWRCQPSSVSGRTKNDCWLLPFRSRLAAARNTRSLSSRRGRETWRRRTASSCRSTTISSSLKSRERSRNAATSSARRNNRYSNNTTKKQPPSTRVRSSRLYGREQAPMRPDAPDGFTHPTADCTARHAIRRPPPGGAAPSDRGWIRA